MSDKVNVAHVFDKFGKLRRSFVTCGQDVLQQDERYVCPYGCGLRVADGFFSHDVKTACGYLDKYPDGEPEYLIDLKQLLCERKVTVHYYCCTCKQTFSFHVPKEWTAEPDARLVVGSGRFCLVDVGYFKTSQTDRRECVYSIGIGQQKFSEEDEDCLKSTCAFTCIGVDSQRVSDEKVEVQTLRWVCENCQYKKKRT